MNNSDRAAIPAIMIEVHRGRIADAGSSTETAEMRCTIIAAASPLSSPYYSTKTFTANAELSEYILSLFDICCIMPDIIESITPNSAQQQQQQLSPSIPHDILRAYIHNARTHCQLENVKVANGMEKIVKLYMDLRRASDRLIGAKLVTINSIVGSIVRFAQIHAKMHLRERVNGEDIDRAIQVVLESYISLQNFTIMRQLRQQFEKVLTQKQDVNERLLFTLNSLVYDEIDNRMLAEPSISLTMAMQQPIRISYERFRTTSIVLAIDQSIYEPFLMNQTSQLSRQLGFSLSEDRQWIVKTFIKQGTRLEKPSA